METIGDYYIEKKDLIGHGAFAIVVKGWKKQDRKFPVAIKCIKKKDLNKSKELLAKEIKVLRELSVHQNNIVELLDVKESDTTIYMILEYCNGGDLADYLQCKGTLSEDTLSSFMQQIASALNVMYDKGIMHRDIKPQNILLCLPKGGNRMTTTPTQITFKIGDFGFARFLEQGKMAGTLCGSPLYMAPEVIMSHKYDSKADLWSLGIIIFQCLTGKAPFLANSPHQLRDFYHSHVDLKPRIPDNTSPELRDMLLRLLMRDTSRRIGIKELIEHPFLKKFRRSPSKREHSASPVSTRRQTPSFSSESSSPGSNREISPLARQVGEVGDMANTLTGSNEEDSGFTKVEKPDTRPQSPDDFVLVPESLPEYNSSGERRGKADRAPLAVAEEEYDAFDQSFTSSQQPVRLHTSEVKAVFRKEDNQRVPSPTLSRLSSPVSPSPSPPLSQRSGGSSAPIPVPSLTRMSAASGSSKSGSPARVKKRSASSGSGDRSGDRLTGRRDSETALAAPDISQVSPPAVQFNIGTPPNTGTWKRTNSLGTGGSSSRLDTANPAPVPVGSPLRRSASCSPGSCFPPYTPYTNPANLPAVTGSTGRHYPYHCHPHQQHHHHRHHHQHHHHHFAAHDPYSRHDAKFHRYPTVPDCTALVAYPPSEESGLDPCHRCGTEPDLRAQPFGANHVLCTAFPPHQQHATLPGLGVLLPMSASRERRTSMGSEKEGGSPCMLEHERRSSLMGDMSSPSSMMFAAASPPTLDPLPSAPPELCEDTLMDDEHNRTMARLRFILDVVDSVMSLAGTKTGIYNTMAESLVILKNDEILPKRQPLPELSESEKMRQQLVLYLRALQMMGQSIRLAQKEMKKGRLQYVPSLTKVLHQQSELYMNCIQECRRLYQQLGSSSKPLLTPQFSVTNADKLLYDYAVQQCQNAVLDEMAGKSKTCFQQYTTAQILLHSLSQLTNSKKDRTLLEKYLGSVEMRLSALGGKAVPPARPT